MSVVTASVDGMNSDLLDLDAKGLLAAATEAERASRLAEVDKLELLSAWAAIHSSDPTEGPDGHVARRVGNVLRQVGGDGTPGVQDFCLGEIALARGAGVTATVNMLADVLDLQHRLPLTWAVTRRGECEVWVARRVAKLSRHLPVDTLVELKALDITPDFVRRVAGDGAPMPPIEKLMTLKTFGERR